MKVYIIVYYGYVCDKEIKKVFEDKNEAYRYCRKMNKNLNYYAYEVKQRTLIRKD